MVIKWGWGLNAIDVEETELGRQQSVVSLDVNAGACLADRMD